MKRLCYAALCVLLLSGLAAADPAQADLPLEPELAALVRDIRKDMRSQDYRTRQLAQENLVALSQRVGDPVKVLPLIEEAMGDLDDYNQTAGREAFKIAIDRLDVPERALPAVSRAMRDSSSYNRTVGNKALEQIARRGVAPRQTLHTLELELGSSSSYARSAAIRALQTIDAQGQIPRDVLEVAEDAYRSNPNDSVRSRLREIVESHRSHDLARQPLEGLPAPSDATPQRDQPLSGVEAVMLENVRVAHKSRAKALRQTGSQGLARLTARAGDPAKVLPAIEEALSSRRKDVREAGAEALLLAVDRLDEPERALPTIERLLGASSSLIANREALLAADPGDRQHLQSLLRLDARSAGSMRDAGAAALERIAARGRAPERVLALSSAAIESKDRRVREAGLLALEQVVAQRGAIESSRPLVTSALQSRYRHVRKRAEEVFAGEFDLSAAGAAATSIDPKRGALHELERVGDQAE